MRLRVEDYRFAKGFAELKPWWALVYDRSTDTYERIEPADIAERHQVLFNPYELLFDGKVDADEQEKIMVDLAFKALMEDMYS